MRECYFDPVASHPALREAEQLAGEIYFLHESGMDYTAELRKLGRVVGQIISLQQVLYAFGTFSSATFAQKCLVNWNAIPTDATESEMLEMLQLICSAKGSAFQLDYWLECLRVNTGDDRVSDLIYWPDEYFGRPVAKELTAAEILEVALGRAKGEHAV